MQGLSSEKGDYPMSKKEISTDAIERNRAWIKTVTNALKTRGDTEFSRIAMRDAGKKCAAQLLEKIVLHFGRTKPNFLSLFGRHV